jgi:conjugative transfer signal peptidase TraF
MTRFGYVMTAYVGAMGTIVTAFVHPFPRLIWNASASVPIGLYRMRSVAVPKPGDLVAVRPPASLSAYMAMRRYLPFGVPMLKHVAAVPGQTVCRKGSAILVDRHRIGAARPRDHAARPLPVWSGCRLLRRGEIFLMNPKVPDSFDGRYFGPLPVSAIVGRLTPVWIATPPRAASQPASPPHRPSPDTQPRSPS